ncbi:hypothetical protein C8Q79DRAFT_956089 [Trametes meyenii]|nr:hypothetical protein C8Q79DRAFT_956089 [Trametes meyenii]
MPRGKKVYRDSKRRKTDREREQLPSQTRWNLDSREKEREKRKTGRDACARRRDRARSHHAPSPRDRTCTGSWQPPAKSRPAKKEKRKKGMGKGKEKKRKSSGLESEIRLRSRPPPPRAPEFPSSVLPPRRRRSRCHGHVRTLRLAARGGGHSHPGARTLSESERPLPRQSRTRIFGQRSRPRPSSMWTVRPSRVSGHGVGVGVGDTAQ